MVRKNLDLRGSGVGAAITVRVIPRSSQTEVAEILNDGTIKIRLKSKSSDEDINKTLLEYLAIILQVQPTQLEIVAGIEGRDKIVSILNLDSSLVQDRILKNLT
jgi:uncharacterized protein YggU (UPF0235/DUF167 family)